MILRALYLSTRRLLEEIVCCVFDCSFFCEPPFHTFKSRAFTWILRADLAPDSFVMSKVRASNWRHLTLASGALLADRIYLRAHGPITVGKWSMIGPEAMIVSGGHRKSDLMPTSSPVVIGDGVFIGARAVILEGVTIGDHAMIGAGAVVARDIPPLAIAVGNPAKIVGYREQPACIWSLTGTIHFPVPFPVEDEIAVTPRAAAAATP